MAINDFDFPGVELHQEFVETPVTGQSQLGVVVVGYQYKLTPCTRKYTGAALSVSLLDLPGYAGDETIDTSASAPKGAFVTDGLFKNAEISGGTSTTVLELEKADIASGRKSVTAEFTTQLHGGTGTPAYTAFGEYQPQLGDTVDIYIGSGTSGTAAVVTAISGDSAKFEVFDPTVSIPAGTVSKVVFWTAVEAEITGVTVTDNTIEIPADASTILKGKSSSNPSLLKTDNEYTFLLKYRVASTVNRLITIGSMSEIQEEFGTISANNPMSIALAFALNAAAGNVVSYVSTTAYTDVAFAKALDFIDKYRDLYSIVPVTETREGDATRAALNQSIIKECIAFADRVSADVEGKTRYSVWYGLDANDATAEEVVSGDLVQTLCNLKAAIGSSYRSQAVWADGVLYHGQEVGTYAVAAAAAGMRSGEVTYRPISNLGYNFFSLAESNGITSTGLKKLGKEGIWLIATNFDGTPINLRQLTAAASNNLNKDEESIVANADSIALTLCRVGENLVGCSNISPDLLVALHDTLTGIMDRYLLNLTGNAYIGPQLLSYTIDRLEQDPVQLDHIYATITCEPPKPFNRFVMTLRIV